MLSLRSPLLCWLTCANKSKVSSYSTIQVMTPFSSNSITPRESGSRWIRTTTAFTSDLQSGEPTKCSVLPIQLSGKQDSNLRLRAPKARTLAGLSYYPILFSKCQRIKKPPRFLREAFFCLKNVLLSNLQQTQSLLTLYSRTVNGDDNVAVIFS